MRYEGRTISTWHRRPIGITGDELKITKLESPSGA